MYTLYRRLFKRKNIDYNGRHVFITGGSSGLGESLATKLYNAGAFVTIVARTEVNLRNVCDKQSKVKQDGKQGKIQYFVFDMNNPEIKAVTRLIDDAEAKFGPINFLFCNAGFSLPQMFLNSEPDAFEKNMSVNYFGYAKISHPVAQRMADRRQGTIVYVSSILG